MKVVLSLLLILSLGLVAAQDSRTIAMGGVMLPDRSAAGQNPAYAANGIEGPNFSLPIPVGAINALTQDSFNYSSNNFDVLPILDQVSFLSTYVLNLPSSPDAITLNVGQDAQGQAGVSLNTQGGADLIFGLADIGYGIDFALPVNFPVGDFRFGVRPYAFVTATAAPDANLSGLFNGGTNQGGLTANVQGEAGVSVDVFYTGQIPNELFGPTGFEGNVYFGVRGAPFVGLAKLDGSGLGQVAVDTAGATPDVSYSYQADAFVSSVATGQLGYGAVTDFGIAAEIPVDNGQASFGFGVTNLGISFWSGDTYSYSGDQAGQTNVDPTATSRTYFSPNLGVHVNGAYDFEVVPLVNLLIAADAGYQSSGFETHLGTEALFGFGEDFSMAARAGIGYENGLSFGVGTGFLVSGVSIDLALTSHIAPFTNHRSYGITTSLGF